VSCGRTLSFDPLLQLRRRPLNFRLTKQPKKFKLRHIQIADLSNKIHVDDMVMEGYA
jgi:hypothetical protein